MSGNIKDSSGIAMVNANLMAIPESDIGSIVFDITNNDGRYALQLLKHTPYRIEVSYLGYAKKSVLLNIQKDSTRNFILSEQVDELDEVVLRYKIPIEIRGDTTTYNTDAFVNGKERKLREILKKLPGIQVDREGNVTAQGKKVTQVLVDDKTFFTGDSKLAVNNIPADAVGEVEILDNYNKVGFLKGLQDSDQMAMNVHLKEDKKKFAFGDIETGGGIHNRYLLHPSLFYYTPNTNISFIGDLNNIGEQSFTLQDYIEFEGGYGKLFENAKNFSSILKNDFAKYLGNRDFKERVNRFGALNLRQALSAKTDVSAYVIANASDTQTESRTTNVYSNNEAPITENRTVMDAVANFFIIGKATLDYFPDSKEKLSLASSVRLTRSSTDGFIMTASTLSDNTFSTLGNLDAVSLRQNLEYSKKFSSAHTFSSQANLEYHNSRPILRWITDRPFLDNLIPLKEDSVFDVFQRKMTRDTSFDFLLKDYWVLNNVNHIYTSLGSNLIFEEYETGEEQRLTDGSINDFSDAGFGNAVLYRFNDVFVGLEYKLLTGIFTFKPAAYYHYYRWNNTQSRTRSTNTTTVLLPEIKVDADIKSTEAFHFLYRMNVQLPDSRQLAGNFLLTDFNRVYRGVASLSNERYHTYTLSYDKYRLLRGLNLDANIEYTRKTQSIKNTVQLEDIEQFNTLVMFNRPEKRISGQFNLSKKIKKIKYTLNTSANYNEFFQLVNANTSKNISKSISTTGMVETFFNKMPKLELGYTFSPSRYNTTFLVNSFTNNELFVHLDYIFEDFQLKAEYTRSSFTNKTEGTKNIFDIANVSVFYQKEDSPWGFELKTSNVFDVRFRRQSYFTDILISDQSTFVMPRILMFKLSYKL